MNNTQAKIAIIKTATMNEFFTQVRKKIRAVSERKCVDSMLTISFENPDDMMQFLSANRRHLIEEIRKHPDVSLLRLAQLVGRDRKIVSSDVKKLKQLGLVEIKERVNPGHGRYKAIRATTDHLKLEVEL